MWRKIFLVFLISFFHFISSAQSAEDIERILALTGLESPEELDEHEVERLAAYLHRPVRINLATVSSLRASGLLTPFQVASIADYRVRHGDIMSFTELSAVDGFTDDIARTLMPFISLDGGSPVPQGNDNACLNSDLAVRGGIKVVENGYTGGYAAKYRCGFGDGWTISLSASSPYSRNLAVPGVFSGCICWEPSRRPFKLIVGDFNTRFGQGLVLWNGMSMTGMAKASSFYRSSTGLSPTWSFTGSSANTGVGCEFFASRIRISALVALPEFRSKGFKATSLLPALNLGWYGRNMYMSVTHCLEYVHADASQREYISDMKTSADVAMTINGTDIFSELAFDWVNAVPAFLAGTRFPVGEDVVMGAHLRYYPAAYNPVRSAAPRSVSKCSNEYGLSLACDYLPNLKRMTGSLSLDTAFLPESKEPDRFSVHLKLLADTEIRVSDSLVAKLRFSERYRTWEQKFKTDFRADLTWSSGCFSVTGRVNLVKYADTSFLAYLEGGYKRENLSIYFRQLFFIADNWDDRIYAYERDAPGNFTVPAFYGRGMNTALNVSYRFSRWGRLYVKGTMTSYPFMPSEKKKPGKAELKLQLVFSF